MSISLRNMTMGRLQLGRLEVSDPCLQLLFTTDTRRIEVKRFRYLKYTCQEKQGVCHLLAFNSTASIPMREVDNCVNTKG